MPIVQPTDPDFVELEKESAYLPASWWRKIDAIAAAERCAKGQTFIQLVRWSLSQPGLPDLPPGPEVAKTKQSSVALTPGRWKQLQEQADSVDLPRNKILQCHLWRAFKQYDLEKAAEKKRR